MPRQVIVNADDFGLSANENAVIFAAFQCRPDQLGHGHGQHAGV